MDLSTVMSVVQAILAVIQTSHQIRQFCSLFGYKSELDELQSTLNTINAVFRDAEAKHEVLSHQEKQYIEELKDAVYDADDVLDEFFTLVQQEKLIDQDNGRVSNKVKSYLSRLKPSAFKLSRKLKKVQRKLDGIATRSDKFSFKVDHQPIKFRKEETCSYVYADDIIGREADVKKIVGMLLDSNEDRDISCLTVVGIGGLGKTALTQLVYNHDRVKGAFPTRLWTCVSDENLSHLDTEATLRKILASTTGSKDDNLTLDGVQTQLRVHVAQKNYLLVLDDVWSENYDDWMKLAGYLKGGEKGSRILVTTRSRQTASVIGNGPMYELPGLSDRDSWRLFERVAFRTEGPDPPFEDWVSIGREIVKKCASVPLAIRAIGSLLYGQPKSKWLSFQQKGLANVGDDEHAIKHILKLSYHHLTLPLKSCFRYCAIFPKDDLIWKEKLIRLWMAQGYIVPADSQDIEDVAEEYFLILLRRCFFQDVIKDEDGEIISCKMHDLMHDIAQEASRNEIRIARVHTIHVDEKVRHLAFDADGTKPVKFSSKIRTCLLTTKIYPGSAPQWINLFFDDLVENCTRLRTLDLSHMGIASLPDSIGNLLHLRYLNLSWNKGLIVLPKSITKLHNLQTLNLSHCWGLKELPKDVGKLVNLRSLDISYCRGLSYMPSGLGTLTSLHTLGHFVVGRASSSGKQFFDDLDSLKPLNHLKGHFKIVIRVPNKDAEYLKKDDGNDMRGSYLMNKEHLNEVILQFEGEEGGRSCENEEAVLEQLLQPHPNLMKLYLRGYNGGRMPEWLRETHLPNLVSLSISFCKQLRWLPSSPGRLSHLKQLWLYCLPEVEYVEIENPEETLGSSGGQASSYFPCLETLELLDLPKLKAWRRSGSELVQSDQHPVNPSSSAPFLPHLKKLRIIDCPEMRSIPRSPSLEEIEVVVDNSNQVKLKVVESPDARITNSPWDPSSSALHPDLHPKPMKLTVTGSEWLKLIPTQYLHSVTEMVIEDVGEVESFTEVMDGHIWCPLRSLEITKCSKLKSVCGWIEHFTALETLSIQNCPDLVKIGEKEDEDGIPWRKLPPTLHSLRWLNMGIPPEGMQFCTSLRSLELWGSKMESVPHWMPNLTSLTHLKLVNCSEWLKDRCQKDIGEDWPLIQQITNLSFKEVVVEELRQSEP